MYFKVQGSEICDPELNWKHTVWELSFIVKESNMPASKGTKQATVMPSYDSHNAQQPG